MLLWGFTDFAFDFNRYTMQGMKKKILWILFALLALTMGLAVLGSYMPQIDGYLEGMRMSMILDKLERQKAEREVRLRADFDGGKTPEETLKLLITALERGDDVQASKYYEIDAQEKMMREFAAENDAVGLKKRAAYFREVLEKGKKTCETNKYETGCDFTYFYFTEKDETASVQGRPEKIFVPVGTRQRVTVQLKLNNLTNVWKLME